MWLTDYSNPNSVTARIFCIYSPIGTFVDVLLAYDNVPAYTYSFEMNEGIDTDNDGESRTNRS
jgi:hypothetical protein